jgi:predicted amidohydrolase YtcJ
MPANLVITGGRVRTMDPARPLATSVAFRGGDAVAADLLAAMEAEDDLALRVFLHQFVYPTTSDDAFAAILAAGTKAGKESGRRWRADGVKFMIDGVIDTGTAWLDEPDLQGAGVEPMWPDVQRFRSRVAQAHAAGFSVATHAIGDRGVRETLDAYAGLPGGPQGRCRVEHIEMVPDATLKRFAAESVVASVQPSHVRWLKPDLSDPWSRRLDVPRCSHAFRSGDIVASGALTVLGSDWPVAPFDPRQGFFAAEARRAHDVDNERPIGASASMSGEQALAGYTRNSALATGEGDRAGLIREGYRADLVLWAEDPSQVAVRDVVQLPVLLTVVDGVAVFRGER